MPARIAFAHAVDDPGDLALATAKAQGQIAMVEFGA
jgi:hypothetical protein